MPGKACVIGAGSSGLAAAKALQERGLPFDWFEKGSALGGLWRYNNDSGFSSAYQGLTINTSKYTMAFSDFPFPEDYPAFSHNTEVLRYLEAYAERFGIAQKVTYQTTVLHVVPLAGGKGGYRVDLRNNTTGEEYSREYASVIVCNGHHWDPSYPELPGKFEGELMHAHDYRTPAVAKGKRVLVLGIGNSGVDIASETAHVGDKVWLASRRGAYVIPRWVGKNPADTVTPPVLQLLPWRWRQEVSRMIIAPAFERQKKAGIPLPKHGMFQAHPTVHKDIVKLCEAGLVIPKPALEKVEGKTVHFVDGTSEEVDLLMACTGYNITFPFLGDDIKVVDADGPHLYRNLIHPDYPGLFFVGLLQPLGPMIPLCEVQSRWVGDLLAGKVELPSVPQMYQAMKEDHAAVRDRFIASKRHLLEVDFAEYKLNVQLERCPAHMSLLGRLYYRVRTILSVAFPSWVSLA